MSRQVGRRFRWNGRWVGIALAAALVSLALGWLFLLRPWPFGQSGSSLQMRLDGSDSALTDYHERIEIALRLQFLQAALVDGRRSSELRTDYRLLEEQLDPIIGRMGSDGSALEAELRRLLPDLTRDRSAAYERLEEMQEMLLPAVGLERQGDGR